MTVTLAKWTLEEYHQLISTGVLANKQVELIRGDIIEMAPEGEPHAYSSTESGNYLVRLLGDRALVRPAKPITLPNQSEPEPDVAIVRPLGREYRRHHPYPENIFWVIEYSDSSLSKDLEIKPGVYAEVNISEYWVVNLQERVLIVFRKPVSGQYTEQKTYTSGTITSLAFPDIPIQVGTVIDA